MTDGFPFENRKIAVPYVTRRIALFNRRAFGGSVCSCSNRHFYKSPLPLTDPRDAAPRAHRAVHRCRRSVW